MTPTNTPDLPHCDQAEEIAASLHWAAQLNDAELLEALVVELHTHYDDCPACLTIHAYHRPH